MKLSTFVALYPAPGEVIIDPNTGRIADPSGSRFLRALFNRTGAGSGIIPSVATGLVAVGASQTTALLLADDWNSVDTVAGGTGVQIPVLQPGQSIAIFNGGGNSLKVYPPGGSQIDALGINAAYTLNATKLQVYDVWTLALIRSRQWG